MRSFKIAENSKKTSNSSHWVCLTAKLQRVKPGVSSFGWMVFLGCLQAQPVLHHKKGVLRPLGSRMKKAARAQCPVGPAT